MENKTIVITVAAVSGGGKTTVVRNLQKEIKNSVALYFDDYIFDEHDLNYLDNIIEWTKNGANYEVFNLEPLVNDIQKYITDENYEYIIIDYPFSYLNSKIKNYINISIFVDTPLDIAMARRIIRDYDDKMNIVNDMKFYLENGRLGYINMLKDIKQSCDIIINGDEKIEKIINEILVKIKSYCA